MNNLADDLPNDDRTITALLFDAATTGDWSFVEHFMLGNSGNALPMADE